MNEHDLPPSIWANDPPNLPNGGVVLFQGDSITDGGRGRSLDPNHILGHSYAFLVAARCAATFPTMRVQFYNRGVSGDRINRLHDRCQEDIIQLRPNLLSILIGVNDAISAVKGLPEACSAADFGKQYEELLREVLQLLPNVRLVMCEPFFVSASARENVEEMETAVKERATITAALAHRFNATLVCFQQTFDEALSFASADHWVWDGIHPTYAGHQLMADQWLRAVNACSHKWP